MPFNIPPGFTIDGRPAGELRYVEDGRECDRDEDVLQAALRKEECTNQKEPGYQVSDTNAFELKQPAGTISDR